MATLIVKTTDGIYEFTQDESKFEHVGWFVEDGVLLRWLNEYESIVLGFRAGDSLQA